MTADMIAGYSDDSFVSHWNRCESEDTAALGRAIIHDTTLRDGEQHVGIAFSSDDKVVIGKQLAKMGVQRVEVCMPAGGADEQRAARELAEADTAAEIWTLIRAVKADAELVGGLGVDGTAVGCLANDQYLSAFRWTLDEIIDKVAATVERARSAGLKTSVMIADSSRMSKQRLDDIITGVDSRCGPDSFAIMDTFGALESAGTAALVAHARTVTGADIEFHGHNDFGLSVANSVAAAMAGASAIHTSVHGLGERIGNTPMEEYVVAANVLYGANLPIDTRQIAELSTIVAEASGLRPPSNKPIVGEFNRIESGTVATEYSRLVLESGMSEQWLLPFTTEYVGKGPVEVVAGKTSGATNVTHLLAGSDFDGLDDQSVRLLLGRIREIATTTKRALTGAEVAELASELEYATQSF